MSADSQVRELLLEWETLRKQGRIVSAESLCRDCPELVESLQQHIEALQSVDRILLSKPPEVRGTLQPHDANDFLPAAPANAEPINETTSGLTTIGSHRSSTATDLKLGTEPVPGFVLVERLGRGGFGEVWKATAPGGFPIALKFVPLEGRGLKIEMRALEIIKAIRHPNLLATFGTWQVSGFLVIAMELADRTLFDRFEEATAQGLAGIPRDELLEYLQEAAKGIDYLNEPQHALEGRPCLGVQHRDIKPQNILLVGRGVKVADFGLARLLEHALTAHTGSLTPAYAAPEFVRGQTSSRSDQYSLGVTYCELRGGRLPFQGNLEKMLFGHLEGTPDLSLLPEEERPIVARALAKDPADRWPTCRDFVAALAHQARHAEDAATGRTPLGGRGSRLSRMLLYAAAAGVFGLLALVAFEGRREPHPDTPSKKRMPIENKDRKPLVTVTDVPAIAAEAATTESNPPAQLSIAPANLETERKTELAKIDPEIGQVARPTELVRVAPAATSVPTDTSTANTAPDLPVGELLCFRQHQGGARCVAFSSDNRHALSAGDDHVLRLWDVETGVVTHRFDGHSAAVHCVAFSPDGRQALSGGDDRTVRLWDVAGRKKSHPLLGHTEAVYCVAFSPDGSRALSAGKDTTVRLWNVETGQELNRIEVSDGKSIWSAAFGLDASHALVASDSPVVRLYNLDTGGVERRLNEHSDVVWSVAFSQKTGHALSGGGDSNEQQDYTVRLWDVDRQQVLKRLEGHRGAVGSVVLSPDCRRAISGSVDTTVRLWSLENGSELHRFEGHTGIVHCVAYSPDGRRALSASEDGTVRVWGLPK